MPLTSTSSRLRAGFAIVVIGVLFATGCANDDLEAERAEELARTCLSIGERRLADELDRGALPGPDRFMAALADVEGRRSGAATIRALCQPRALVDDR
ncbi:MAG: hypothetical protein HKN26_08580 [Acidimicrobiales bacterium]|nr:hypothetical protein [Acidimicrobiales bacterium]